MSEFKYSAEFSINMFLSSYQFLQQTELEEFATVQKIFTEYNPCNIYFVLRRPRLSLDPKYLITNSNYIELKYFIHIEDNKYERKLKLRVENPSDIILESQYPYKYFSLKDGKGLDVYFKLAVLVDEVHKQSNEPELLLDYEVLYIGQAFGEDGNRTAIDSLGSHSTLQKIYSEAMQKNPDSEIWLMLAAFTERKIGLMNGTIIPQANENEDLTRFTNYMNPTASKFTDRQKINFTEAALIRTFLPSYNKEYKESFPNPSHSSYSECYKIGVNGIVVETDTTEVKRWLYSESKSRDSATLKMPYWQHGLFHFVSDEDRYKMFNNEFI